MTVDYAAELARIRQEQGLEREIPDHIRDAVAALLTAAPADETERLAG